MAVVRPSVAQLAQSAQTYDFNILVKPLLAALADFTAFADPDAGISPGGPFSVFSTVTAWY